MSQGSQTYSSLEVHEPDPEQYQKQVVSYPDHSLPQPMPLEQRTGASPTYTSPESTKEVVTSASEYGYYKPGQENTYNQHPGYAGAYVDPHAANSPPGPYGPVGSPMSGGTTAVYSDQYPPLAGDAGEKAKAPAATICGMKKRTFYIILAVAILIIVAAVAGGVAGGLAAQNSSKTSSADSKSPADGSSSGGGNATASDSGPKPLDISKLTASNFTDGDGVVHRTLFFQDEYNSIIARRWDSKSKSWATDNLTDQLIATTRPLDVAAGTPLASASMDLDPHYETHLWFLDPNNYIHSMAATDAVGTPSGWANDTLDDAFLQTWDGGQLAAMWQRCEGADCDGTWVVAYQRPEGAIKTANSSMWATATVAVNSTDVAANSSLAIIPQLSGPWLDAIELVSEKASSTRTMRVTTYADTWDSSEDRVTELITDIPQPATRQQFTVTKWGSWNQALYLALLSDGTLEGTHYDGTSMKSLAGISFNGGPDVSFTAIAMTTDAMFYGISDDEVLEYSLDTSNPSQFTYVGVAYP
ncbi:Uu.00g070530.m01.CDS01 [Anthostomella pinea]|uniref:Uu.00g070530.m01.CDS01 n=1 Tax=Anthostomella pinea TaxID=933095 RepID=A0AAI8VVX5_9PEZI|nr:Uu.00g070530.m01.CDS01 [Anthostomella pinea]